MYTARFTVRILTIAMLAFACALVAQAQAPRTWVSGVGDDINPCSRTAPCKTFAGAISKTFTGGEIDILDAGGFGTLSITKSITVDGLGAMAGVLNTGGINGISINFDSFAVGDTRKAVALRNLSIEGAGAATTGARGIRINGGAVIAGGFVRIENCNIEGDTTSPGRGIEDTRTNGGKLFVSNTTFNNLSGTAISHNITGAVRLDWTIDNVRIFNCAFGIAIGSGARAVVSRSVISGCANAGLFAEGPVGASELNAENNIINNNGTGVQNNAGGTTRLSNNTISNNTTGITGTTLSYGNNRIAGNTSAGTAPTPIGAASNNFGQQ
jgi:hypothetical protein